jgi:hypothetical protein
MMSAIADRFKKIWHSLEAVEGLNGQQLLVVLLVSISVVLLRRVSDVLTPEFCCEDGSRFYADAYNLGWFHALWLPSAGYMNFFPRLVAALALLVPLRWAPLLEAMCGAFIQTLPAMALLLRRASPWGPFPIRCVMAALYVLMTNSAPLHVVVVNSPWHLAVLIPILAFSDPPATRVGYVADTVLFLFAATSGPYAIVMLPILAYRAWLSRKSWHWVQTALIALGAIAQCFYLATTPRGIKPVLGANLPDLLRILGGNVFLDTIFGGRIPFASHLPFALILAAVVIGAVIFSAGYKAAPPAMRTFTIYAFLLLAVSLYRPLSATTEPAWPQWVRFHGERYYYIPVVACTWTLIWASVGRAPISRITKLARLCLCLLPVGIGLDLIHPNDTESHFATHAQEFESSPPGRTVQIPLSPKGSTMTLKKH